VCVWVCGWVYQRERERERERESVCVYLRENCMCVCVYERCRKCGDVSICRTGGRGFRRKERERERERERDGVRESLILREKLQRRVDL